MQSILNDISQYFEFLKETGIERLNISDKSKHIIDELGLSFQGRKDSNIYIVDSKSVFFTGEAGDLLVKILKAMGLEKGAVCICDASSREALHKRLKRIHPQVIITLGDEGARLIINNHSPFKFLRGRFHEFHGIKVMPTWHPLDLIADPDKKRDVWEDMKMVMKLLGL